MVGQWCSKIMMKRWGPCLGCMAELEVQRTIKRAGLTAFQCLLKRVIGPLRVHVDDNGIIDGLRKGEGKCIKPRAGDADLWIQNFGKNGLAERGILVEVARRRRSLSKVHPEVLDERRQ